jgi:hypothetical protein
VGSPDDDDEDEDEDDDVAAAADDDEHDEAGSSWSPLTPTRRLLIGDRHGRHGYDQGVPMDEPSMRSYWLNAYNVSAGP